MGTQTPLQATVITKAAVDKSTTPLQIALFNGSGTQLHIPGKAAAQADTTAADLAALKVDFNALLAKLRAANIIAT